MLALSSYEKGQNLKSVLMLWNDSYYCSTFTESPTELTRFVPVICLIKLSIIIACSVVGVEEAVVVVVPEPGAAPFAVESLKKKKTRVFERHFVV